ncbi:MAG: bifunctional phosphoribosylaminoimidazolecarboxamide formyltransferase/IMP cyclohydrolase [Planctomycetaceae bacterium]|nr:bifunctional phosphoribosylaminoimidazolecarboxamide formyltransferase/IMP cyclohydrolase [Planctomycetaceae bacterium]MCB9949383.1 bifunctional phosphoribosylaminoimidazolecarboxamide formyltransferase/IMP cyclohydrolase [Planctomycetaceae bacterium]
MTSKTSRRALVSVSDKSGLLPFVQGLVELGFEILSTGGTARFLKEGGVEVIDVSTYTGFPEIMGGRVKTLHPKVHGAILGRPDLPSDAEAISEHGIVPFELVVVNLYPFAQTIAKPDVTVEDAIENIDIGGPSMIRSAAKNHAYLGVVTSACQYEEVLSALKAGEMSLALRRRLAKAAFGMTAEYDRTINAWFEGLETPGTEEEFPERLNVSFECRQRLRYGENPHQSAAFYVEDGYSPASLAAAKQLHGKELSYNNLLDLDAALCIVRDFSSPTAVVIKHNNPCGCATGESLADAFHRAYEGDPVSAFGSIIGFNREVDVKTAERLCEPGRFVEALIAPAFAEGALEVLRTKPKWKNNVRLLEVPGWDNAGRLGLDYRRVTGGLLVQERDIAEENEQDWQVVTERQPTDAEMHDMRFGWKVCKHVKSNAIVFVKEGMTVGVGAGQMSRLDSSHIAAYKSGDRSQGAVVCSDAFFPFRDGIDEAAKVGVTAAIQPGGSRNDAEVIAACNEHGIAMVFTGRRHFKH